MMLGFVVFGPVSGALSDKIGARLISTVGLVISAVAFLLLATLPYNFAYVPFALMLFMMGSGMGMFAAPNITAVMNSVKPQLRGVASGMRATLQNTGQTASMGIFFTIVLVYLTRLIPGSFGPALATSGAPVLIPIFDKLPPTSALFSAFLGYNPVGTILSEPALAGLSALIPHSVIVTLEGKIWFPTALAGSFMTSLRMAFIAGFFIFIVGAILSALRGKKVIYDDSKKEVVNESGSSSPTPSVSPSTVKTEEVRN